MAENNFQVFDCATQGCIGKVKFDPSDGEIYADTSNYIRLTKEVKVYLECDNPEKKHQNPYIVKV